MPGGEPFESKSEQYAESRPREGGVFSVLSRFCMPSLMAMLSLPRAAAETETIRWRGPQYASESRELLGCATGASLRLANEKRFRIDTLLETSGAGVGSSTCTGSVCCIGAAGGLGDGRGV